MRYMQYSDRLKALNLTTLSCRRDMLETFKYLNKLYSVHHHTAFSPQPADGGDDYSRLPAEVGKRSCETGRPQALLLTASDRPVELSPARSRLRPDTGCLQKPDRPSLEERCLRHQSNSTYPLPATNTTRPDVIPIDRRTGLKNLLR